MDSKNEFYLNDRLIGHDHLPVVIAEIGINHGGSLKVAKKMVDAAANTDVEIIKHQLLKQMQKLGKY